MATLQIAVILSIVVGSLSYPEQGKFHATLGKNGGYVGFTKTAFKNTRIKLKVDCDGEDTDGIDYTVGWFLRYTPCSDNYNNVIMDEATYSGYYNAPQYIQANEKLTKYQQSEGINLGTCGSLLMFKDESGMSPQVLLNTNQFSTKTNTTVRSSTEAMKKENVVDAKDKSKKVRDVDENAPDKVSEASKDDGNAAVEAPKDDEVEKSTQPHKKATTKPPANKKNVVTTTWEDGTYYFIVFIQTETPTEGLKLKFSVDVEMESSKGFISAIDYPLLIFYAVMCVVYSLMALLWLFCSACQWRDLLRIQFWIGGVILLGLLEKAVFLGEYQHVNTNGESVSGAVIFAELVSSLKRTVARMLVIIVSLGFGIVKPRLGPMLHRVLGVGALYFILGSIEGCLRAMRTKQDPSKQALLASIPLAVLDAAICWWIFTSLVQTTRTLRLRRNVVKLSLYRHFTNTLIFCVVAALIFMVWSIKAHRFTDCLTDWRELWIDEAYWHLLFVIVLLVIMVLWRPTANNQRYAFSPLSDMADSEDEEEPKEAMMNDAFEGMKMRGVGGKSNGSHRMSNSQEKTDADLKWVEENIPQSIADAALPSLLDSDEEIMTTKFEMSKME